MDLAIFRASAVTSPEARPWALAETVIWRLPSLCWIWLGALPIVMVAICSSGTTRLAPPATVPTATGKRSMLLASTRSSGARRTDTSRVSPCGSTQSPTSTPAKATRSACAASLAEMPKALARPRSSSIFNSFCGSCSDRPTSTAPGTWRRRVTNSLVISSSLRESGPVKRTCTGFCAPMLKSSSTTYSAPTRRAVRSRKSLAMTTWLRGRSVLLPMSTYTRPPFGFAKALVALVSGKVRASAAAASTLRLA